MSMNHRILFPCLASAFTIVMSAVAAATEPAPDLNVAQWADDRRMVSAESGSPRPGKWDTSITPYLREPMECLSPNDPMRSVTIRSSAQTGKTEVGMNWLGFTVDVDPMPCLVIVPSLEEMSNWNRTKWQPMVDATPELSRKVAPSRSRSEEGSTTSFKRFVGGFLNITTALSSKGLQSRSIARLFCDEVSEFPADAGGRGDPIDQGQRRLDAWDDVAKELYTSTPKDLPTCRITLMFEAGDQRYYYLPCPHCGEYQRLEFDNLTEDDGRAVFGCPACEFIEHHHKTDMLAGGVWIKSYPSEDPDNPAPPLHFSADELDHWRSRGSEGRQASFHIWQAYSPFKTWDSILAHWKRVKDKPSKLKVFRQQILALPDDDSGEAPDTEKLALQKGGFDYQCLPPETCAVFGAADVQGNRLEWGVYAAGPFGRYLIDKGVIEGAPEEPEVWRELGEVLNRTYENDTTGPLGIDLFGVDSGYMSHHAYKFCQGRPNVFALKGAKDQRALPLGTPTPQKIKIKGRMIGKILLYPVGTFGLKKAHYHALRLTIDGRDTETGRYPVGSTRYPSECDLEYFEQLTNEALTEHKDRSGNVTQRWDKLGPNEALDIAVYTRALAWFFGADRWEEDDWRKVFTARAKNPLQELPGLERLWMTEIEPAEDGEAEPVDAPLNAVNNELQSYFERLHEINGGEV